MATPPMSRRKWSVARNISQRMLKTSGSVACKSLRMWLSRHYFAAQAQGMNDAAEI